MRVATVSTFVGVWTILGSASLLRAGINRAATTSVSDTTLLYVHEVPVSKSADYERWMSEVWKPALRKAAQVSAVQRQLASTERDFRPAEKTNDGTYTYVGTFEVSSPTDSLGHFPERTLLAAGYSPAQAREQAQKLWAMIRVSRGYKVVEKPY